MAIAESGSISPEIVGDDLCLKLVQCFETDGLYHPAFLEDAAHDQEAALVYDGTESLEQIGHDDEIREPGLVFQRDKDDIVRSHRPLPDDDSTGDRHDLA